MPVHIRASQYWTIVVVVALFSICCINPARAGSQAFSGVTTSIIPDKSCSEKPENTEITLVFDGDSKSASTGWFYGKGTMPAEFKRITPTRFAVTYAITRHKKLPPSIMELFPSKYGFSAVIRDHIPEGKELRESACFFERLEVNLKPVNATEIDFKIRAEELFAADLITLESDDLLWIRKEYKTAIELAQKALPLYERNCGKWGKEALNASAVIIFALMMQDRFDEALEVITPYLKALPDQALLKDVEAKIMQLKKKQDDLFRYDPDSPSTIDLEPLGQRWLGPQGVNICT